MTYEPSAFALKQMARMGHKAGAGLGKREDGRPLIEVQFRHPSSKSGLGFSSQATPPSTFERNFDQDGSSDSDSASTVTAPSRKRRRLVYRMAAPTEPLTVIIDLRSGAARSLDPSLGTDPVLGSIGDAPAFACQPAALATPAGMKLQLDSITDAEKAKVAAMTEDAQRMRGSLRRLRLDEAMLSEEVKVVRRDLDDTARSLFDLGSEAAVDPEPRVEQLPPPPLRSSLHLFAQQAREALAMGVASARPAGQGQKRKREPEAHVQSAQQARPVSAWQSFLATAPVDVDRPCSQDMDRVDLRALLTALAAEHDLAFVPRSVPSHAAFEGSAPAWQFGACTVSFKRGCLFVLAAGGGWAPVSVPALLSKAKAY